MGFGIRKREIRKCRAAPEVPAVDDFKRRLFTDAFSRAKGDYKIAAELLGLHEKCIHRFLKSLNLTHLLKKGPAF